MTSVYERLKNLQITLPDELNKDRNLERAREGE
jgi:hypothetical protein